MNIVTAIVFTLIYALYILILYLYNYPICPVKSVAYIAGERYCMSFVWISIYNIIIQSFIIVLYITVIHFMKIKKISYFLLLIPAILLLFRQYGYTMETMDQIAHQTADKVKFQDRIVFHGYLDLISNGSFSIL